MTEFRKMRRGEKEVSEETAYGILRNCSYITLSVKLENGFPYAVPLNHVYEENRVYFHCAIEGEKTDAFKYDSRVCFSAVDMSHTVPEKFTTSFRSITAFGNVNRVEGDEKVRALTYLIRRFSPDFYENGLKYIEKMKDKTAVYAVDIEHITGKESIR